MRRVNAIVSALMMIFFLIHMIWGSLILLGLAQGGSPVLGALSRILCALLFCHMLFGLLLTAKSVRAVKKSGTFYIRENARFLVSRISGFALALLMLLHVKSLQLRDEAGALVLPAFDLPFLLLSLLMVLCLILHLLANLRPLSIGLGLRLDGGAGTDLALTLAILLALSAAAFVIYYLRWTA